jgi:hypothetical protein
MGNPLAMADAVSGPVAAKRLGDILKFLAFWDRDDDVESAAVAESRRVSESRKPMEGLLGPSGALGWLKWAKKNKTSAGQAELQLRGASRELRAGNWNSFLSKLLEVDLSWLRIPEMRQGRDSNGNGGDNGSAHRQGRVVLDSTATRTASWQHTVLYLAEAICPWDYDRKEPSLTFVNVWTDVEAITTDRDTTKVKVTSTIKPLHQEWKLTARTKLLKLGDEGIVFGKAGIYLVGDKDPYVGVEADRTWQLPKLSGTKLFLNANYRSSRKPDSEPVVASIGLQQRFRIRQGLEFTLRAGVGTQNGMSRMYLAPIPFGSYY